MNLKGLSLLLKIAAVLWLIWGVVHMFAGVMTMNFAFFTNDIAAAIGGIADAVDPESLQGEYPAALGGILGQHGFNLFWIGVVTTICSFLIWRKNGNAIFLAAITGGLADLGYFLFIDIPGFNLFVPGTVMTIFSGLAILLSFYAYYKSDKLMAFKAE